MARRPSVSDKYYNGFCKKFLWPLMHYILPMSPASQGSGLPDIARHTSRNDIQL